MNLFLSKTETAIGVPRTVPIVFDTKYVTASCTRCRALKTYFFKKIARLKCKKDKE
jgi:hypothetical protein